MTGTNPRYLDVPKRWIFIFIFNQTAIIINKIAKSVLCCLDQLLCSSYTNFTFKLHTNMLPHVCVYPARGFCRFRFQIDDMVIVHDPNKLSNPIPGFHLHRYSEKNRSILLFGLSAYKAYHFSCVEFALPNWSQPGYRLDRDIWGATIQESIWETSPLNRETSCRLVDRKVCSQDGLCCPLLQVSFEDFAQNWARFPSRRGGHGAQTFVATKKERPYRYTHRRRRDLNALDPIYPHRGSKVCQVLINRETKKMGNRFSPSILTTKTLSASLSRLIVWVYGRFTSCDQGIHLPFSQCRALAGIYIVS